MPEDAQPTTGAAAPVKNELKCAITGEVLATPQENVANRVFDLTASNDVTVQIRAYQGNRPASSVLSKAGLNQALREAADNLATRFQ